MPKKVIIIGAGITGLSAGWTLAENGCSVKVIEKSDLIGGMSATFNHKDYYLDYGPHKIFTVMQHIMDRIKQLFQPEELLCVRKTSKVRIGGKYLKFPLGLRDIFLGLGLWTGFKCGIGYFWALCKNISGGARSRSYEEWVMNRFGKPIYNLVLGPYAAKIWGPPHTLSHELAETRIAAPNLLEMIKQMIFGYKKGSPVINAEEFYYPSKGFGDISLKMADKIRSHKGKIINNTVVSKFEFDRNSNIRKIHYSNGKHEEISESDLVISTIPLIDLISLLPKKDFRDIKDTAAKLKTRGLILFYIELDVDRVIDSNWLFFPEARYKFNRIFEQKAFNKNMVKDGKTVLCIEITCDTDDSLWSAGDNEIFAMIEPQLKEAELIKGKIIEYFTKRIRNGYPVYDIHYKSNLTATMKYMLQFKNLYSVGRQGGFSYTGMADSMDIGIYTGKFIIDGRDKHSEWIAYTDRFYNYIVVD